MHLEKKVVLTVDREFDWRGRFVSSFFHDGQLILTSVLNSYLHYNFIKIKYKLESLPVQIYKRHGRYSFLYNGAILNLKAPFLGFGKSRFFKDGVEVGQVNRHFWRRGGSPNMELCFNEEDEANFYLGVLYLVQLPSQELASG